MRFYLFFIAILFSLDCPAFNVSGTVTDRSGAPVSGAMVKFVDAKQSSKEFFARTNNSGQYSVEISVADNMSLFCYPNPFNRQTVISFHLDQKQRVEITV